MAASSDITIPLSELTARDTLIAELKEQVRLRDERVSELEEQVRTLAAIVESLRQQLNQNSSNSNLPPSSDAPGSVSAKKKNRKKAGKGQSKRKRGGQPGHRGSRRKLVPVEEVDEVVDLFPPECENCWEALPEAPDSRAKRYQSTELPPIRPHTTEYRRHAVRCPCCDYTTRAVYDSDVIPASPFGPRLMSVVALLTGVYHLSRRKAVVLLLDLVGVRISVGAVSAVEKRVSDAVKPAVDEAWEQVTQAKVKHTDGTSWLQAG